MFIIVQNRKLVPHFLNTVSSLLSLVLLSWFLACGPQCLRFWDSWSALTGCEHSYSAVLGLINFLGNWNVGKNKADRYLCGSAGVISCPAGLAWVQNWGTINLLVPAFHSALLPVSGRRDWGIQVVVDESAGVMQAHQQGSVQHKTS